ncbi:MAG: malonyl-[acyl-carrier protein] O-methyltransferase BioC [Cycloclasticus sp.]|nr:MAG: malonyl-[acyl-carrier protein] O-methyltransferase BioC [Cycloclasticus sp.]
MSSVTQAQAIIDKSLVQQSFDDASQCYNQFTSLQRTIGDRLMAEKKATISQSIAALDVGVGTGYLSKQIAQLKNIDTLFALDISLGMLQQADNAMRGIKPIELFCADAEQLPMGDSRLGAVYSNLAFQWCDNLQQVFSESYRVLQPVGEFVFSTFGPATLNELKQSWQTVDDLVHVNAFVSVEEINAYLRTAGFQKVSVRSENIVMYYQTPKHLMLDLKGMGAHNMNPGRQHGLTGIQAFKMMIGSYEKKRTAKGIPATFQAVYAYATK